MKSNRKNLDPVHRIWEDPSIYHINRRQMTATAVRFSSKDGALTGKTPDRHISLNGYWKFNWTPYTSQQLGEFFRCEFDDKDWADIKVPGTWQMQGYGNPHYRNIGLPPGIDEKHPPRIDPQQNSAGRYRKTFTLPEDWQDPSNDGGSGH